MIAPARRQLDAGTGNVFYIVSAALFLRGGKKERKKRRFVLPDLFLSQLVPVRVSQLGSAFGRQRVGRLQNSRSVAESQSHSLTRNVLTVRLPTYSAGKVGPQQPIQCVFAAEVSHRLMPRLPLCGR